MRCIKAPCPGCGKTELYRASTKVCNDCKIALDLGHKAMARQKPRSGEGVYTIGFATYAWKYVPHQPHTKGGGSFQCAFDQLVRLLGRDAQHSGRAGDWEAFRPVMGEGYSSERLTIRRDVVPLLVKLYLACLESVNAAYDTGVEEGRSFILQLARGEYSQLKAEGIFNERRLAEADKA